MGIRGGEEGRRVRQARRDSVSSGTASGRDNVIPLPRRLIRGVNGNSHLPMCTMPWHFGAIRNEAGCIAKNCGYYRQFMVNPKGTIRSEGRAVGEIQYKECPIGEPSNRETPSSEQSYIEGRGPPTTTTYANETISPTIVEPELQGGLEGTIAEGSPLES